MISSANGVEASPLKNGHLSSGANTHPSPVNNGFLSRVKAVMNTTILVSYKKKFPLTSVRSKNVPGLMWRLP